MDGVRFAYRTRPVVLTYREIRTLGTLHGQAVHAVTSYVLFRNRDRPRVESRGAWNGTRTTYGHKRIAWYEYMCRCDIVPMVVCRSFVRSRSRDRSIAFPCGFQCFYFFISKDILFHLPLSQPLKTSRSTRNRRAKNIVQRYNIVRVVVLGA